MTDLLGLDPTASKVYRALLTHPQEGLSELGARTGLAPARLTDAVDRLLAIPLVRPSRERPCGYRALPPEAAIGALLASREEELAVQQRKLALERAAAAQLIAECAELAAGAAQPAVEQLSTVNQVRECLGDLTRDAQEEVLTFAPQGAHLPDSIAAAKPLDEELRDRGVKVRTIYLDSARSNPATADYLAWLTGIGNEVRTVAALPVRMVVFDRRVGVVPTDPADSSQGAVVLRAGGAVAALCALFEVFWSNATELAHRPAPDHRGLTPQEATALRLLGEGMTDDTIAKRLGVSPRTARRIAADLMLGLEATSRFQAGLHAAQRGWLPAC